MNPADIQRLNEKPTEPQGDSDEMIVFDYKARVKALQDIQSDTEIVRDPDLKQAVLIGRAFLAKWKDAWIADDPDREPLFQRWARESKEIKEDGRPRGAAHIENERFWDLPDDQLHYIIKDASEAINANPTARKATQGPGNWSDQVNDAATVLTYRKNKRSKADEDTNEGQYYDSDTDIYISNDEWERMNEEAEGIAGALDTMRKQFNDYNQDPSNRWEKYDQYRNQRKQISQRAKDLK